MQSLADHFPFRRHTKTGVPAILPIGNDQHYPTLYSSDLKNQATLPPFPEPQKEIVIFAVI
jgi:hypothetical protein